MTHLLLILLILFPGNVNKNKLKEFNTSLDGIVEEFKMKIMDRERCMELKLEASKLAREVKKFVKTTPDLDPEMKVVADFDPYDPPKFVKTANVLGMVYDAKVPGKLRFEIRGQKFEMEPNLDGDLHLRFTDETTGEETYGLGRYLHAAMPDESNKVVLDFNKAYNPPCAFTEYATCPLPPKANHISFKLFAGEKGFELH